MSHRVSIIILNWNGGEDTVECLHSLGRLNYPDYRITVIDNGSHDGSPDLIERDFPGVAIVRLDRNHGFAEANNIGIEQAVREGTDFVLMLNNDTTVDPGLLTAFVDSIGKHPDAGFLGAKIYYYDDPRRISLGMPVWNPRTCWFDYVGTNQLDGDGAFEEVREVAYASGCALFFSTRLTETVGLMDSRFFCYFEEVDWCARARERGLKTYAVPNAKVWHKTSTTYGGFDSPIISYFRARNKLLWAEKHLGLRQRGAVLRNILAPVMAGVSGTPDQSRLKRIYWKILSLRQPPASTTLHGVRDYFLRRFGDCPPAVRETAG